MKKTVQYLFCLTVVTVFLLTVVISGKAFCAEKALVVILRVKPQEQTFRCETVERAKEFAVTNASKQTVTIKAIASHDCDFCFTPEPVRGPPDGYSPFFGSGELHNASQEDARNRSGAVRGNQRQPEGIHQGKSSLGALDSKGFHCPALISRDGSSSGMKPLLKWGETGMPRPPMKKPVTNGRK